MCGRYALGTPIDQVAQVFEVTHNRFPEWTPRWNIAPTSTVPLIIDTDKAGASRSLGPARWSLTPSWSETLDPSYPTFNARSETAAKKPTFRDAVKKFRGIIPASGYFEWHTEGRIKTPHYIYPDNGLFAFAALYSVWGPAESSTVTATILTMDAPPALAWIHPRSPVALPPSEWSEWMDPATVGTDALVQRAVHASVSVFSSVREHPVKPLQGDSAALTLPAGDDGPPMPD